MSRAECLDRNSLHHASSHTHARIRKILTSACHAEESSRTWSNRSDRHGCSSHALGHVHAANRLAPGAMAILVRQCDRSRHGPCLIVDEACDARHASSASVSDSHCDGIGHRRRFSRPFSKASQPWEKCGLSTRMRATGALQRRSTRGRRSGSSRSRRSMLHGCTSQTLHSSSELSLNSRYFMATVPSTRHQEEGGNRSQLRIM